MKNNNMMNNIEYSKMTDQDLLEIYKKFRKENITRAVLIGLLIGIAVYSTVIKGMGFFTFFPLIFAIILLKKSKTNDNLMQELKSRNLNK